MYVNKSLFDVIHPPLQNSWVNSSNKAMQKSTVTSAVVFALPTYENTKLLLAILQLQKLYMNVSHWYFYQYYFHHSEVIIITTDSASVESFTTSSNKYCGVTVLSGVMDNIQISECMHIKQVF